MPAFLDPEGPVEATSDQLDQLADRDVLSAADVDRPAQGRIASRDREEALHRVLHIRQVATRIQPAEYASIIVSIAAHLSAESTGTCWWATTP